MGVELEAQPGVGVEAAADRLEARRLAQPERVDEPQRPRLSPQHLVQRLAPPPQREGQRGGFQSPVAPAPRGGGLPRPPPPVPPRPGPPQGNPGPPTPPA